MGQTGVAYGDHITGFRDITSGTGDDILTDLAKATLTNGTNDNVFTTGAGNDLLTGGTGKDILTGGSGADRFIFTALTDSTLGSYDRDQINDFVGADGDRLDLGRIDANAALGGNQSFTFIGDAAFSGALGKLRVVQVGKNLQITANISGDIKADFSILVMGHPDLTAADFIL